MFEIQLNSKETNRLLGTQPGLVKDIHVIGEQPGLVKDMHVIGAQAGHSCVTDPDDIESHKGHYVECRRCRNLTQYIAKVNDIRLARAYCFSCGDPGTVILAR